MIKVETKIKVNDVYSFRYNEMELSKRFSPHHCFDGQLVAQQRPAGEIYLFDTYWASKYDKFTKSNEGRIFTIESALQQGELKFICNLEEVEEIREHEKGYYDDNDLFDLSYQNNCYNFFTKRIGAARSKEKMLRTIIDKIEEAEYKLKTAERNIREFKEAKEKIESNDLSVYL